jgi:predicted DNA-binding ribbon-helix-helix protein
MKKAKPMKQIITTMRVDREFWGQVRTRAFAEGLSVKALIVKVLGEYLKKAGRELT